MTDTATTAYLDRFKAREKFVGENGSIYSLRQLRPSEIFRVRDMLKDADPATFNVMVGIASICEIEAETGPMPITFRRNRKDLDFILDRVGMTGLAALTPAFNKVNGAVAEDSDATEAEADEA